MSSPALYWTTAKTETANMGEALFVAQQLMQQAGLVNIVKTQVDVSGRTPNSHAAVTCLKTGTYLTAVIMVAGDDAKAVRAKLADAFNNATWL